MSKPLQGNPKRQMESSAYHALVFKTYGKTCWFGPRVGHPKKPASDAAHIIKRSHLGPLRYAKVEFARPLCRSCHVKQEANVEGYAFDRKDINEAVKAHNEIAKIPLTPHWPMD